MIWSEWTGGKRTVDDLTVDRTDSGDPDGAGWYLRSVGALTLSSGDDLPVFCSIHDSFGSFLAIGIVEECDDPRMLRVARIRPTQALAVSLARWGQREFVLRLSGGRRCSGLVQPPDRIEQTRSCDFLVLGREVVTQTGAQATAQGPLE